MTDKSWNIEFKGQKCLISNYNQTITGYGLWDNGSYYLQAKIPKNKVYLAKDTVSKQLIHQRLSHISDNYISKTLHNITEIEKIDNIKNIINYENCLTNKYHKLIN